VAVDRVTVDGNTVKIELTLETAQPEDDEPEDTEGSSDGPSILGIAGAVVSGAAVVAGAVYDAIKPESDDE